MIYRFREQARSHICFVVFVKPLLGSNITVINLPVQPLFARLDSAHSKKR